MANYSLTIASGGFALTVGGAPDRKQRVRKIVASNFGSLLVPPVLVDPTPKSQENSAVCGVLCDGLQTRALLKTRIADGPRGGLPRTGGRRLGGERGVLLITIGIDLRWPLSC